MLSLTLECNSICCQINILEQLLDGICFFIWLDLFFSYHFISFSTFSERLIARCDRKCQIRCGPGTPCQHFFLIHYCSFVSNFKTFVKFFCGTQMEHLICRVNYGTQMAVLLWLNLEVNTVLFLDQLELIDPYLLRGFYVK